MAMGGRGQREAQAAIAACRPFSNSTGSLRGTQGGTRELGNLRGCGINEEMLRRCLRAASYVVWSYNTPIGFVLEDDEVAPAGNYYIDVSHSVTTSHHQTILRVGFSDFHTMGQGPWSRSNRAERRSPRARLGQPRPAFGLPVVGQREAERAVGLVTNHRGVQYDPRVERDTSYERDMAQARELDRNNETPQSSVRPVYRPRVTGVLEATDYTPAEVEDAAQASLAAMLDPRYADPDWVPFTNVRRGITDDTAEYRDEERVRREQARRPDPYRL